MATAIRVVACLLALACLVWSSRAVAAGDSSTAARGGHPHTETAAPSYPHPLTNISSLIQANQFRTDCATRRFLLVDPSIFNVRTHPRSYAKGAKVHKEDTLDLAKLHLRLAGALAEAIHSNRTLLFSESSRVIREPKLGEVDQQPKKKHGQKTDGVQGDDAKDHEAPAAGDAAPASPTELTTQQIVKIFMRKCNLFHHTSHRPFYTADEPGVARLRYHHSCWFKPISNCAIEDHATSADWAALEGRPNAHENRLKFSDFAQAQAALWVPPAVLRTEEEQSHSEMTMGVVERWSSSLVDFLLRPVSLMEKHLSNYVKRVSGEFMNFVPGQNHLHLTGASMRLPPAKPTGTVQTMTVTQHWKQYLRILEQLVQRQQQLQPEERLFETQHIWISTWEPRQFDLIESWHDTVKRNNTWLKEKHVIISQLRDVESQHHEEDALDLSSLEDGDSSIDAATFGATVQDQRDILDRLNLQALHALEDVAILGRSSYFIASVSQPHAVWLQLVRYTHLFVTPPIWLHSPFSAESFFPDETGFERDELHPPQQTEGQQPSSGGMSKKMSNAERWNHVVQVLRPQNAAELPKPRLSPDTALPEIPFGVIDDLLPLWNVPVMPLRRAPAANSRYSKAQREKEEAEHLHDEL
jgi:hypothetical protein